MKVREELQEITKENNNAYGISDSLNLHKNFLQSWNIFKTVKSYMKMCILKPSCILNDYHIFRGNTLRS